VQYLSGQTSREKAFGQRNITLERVAKLPSVSSCASGLKLNHALEAQREQEAGLETR
jgi:hypothetical protein